MLVISSVKPQQLQAISQWFVHGSFQPESRKKRVKTSNSRVKEDESSKKYECLWHELFDPTIARYAQSTGGTYMCSIKKAEVRTDRVVGARLLVTIVQADSLLGW